MCAWHVTGNVIVLIMKLLRFRPVIAREAHETSFRGLLQSISSGEHGIGCRAVIVRVANANCFRGYLESISSSSRLFIILVFWCPTPKHSHQNAISDHSCDQPDQAADALQTAVRACVQGTFTRQPCEQALRADSLLGVIYRIP